MQNTEDHIMSSKSLMNSYSSIISPEEYNRIITEEHLYIEISDRYIEKIIRGYSAEEKKEVVEIGCGPGRILKNMSQIQNIQLTGLDVDTVFLDYAKKIINNPDVRYICSSIEDFKNDKQVDIFYSQGFHHHIPKGTQTLSYLSKVYKMLKPGGLYIVGDEFIPPYKDEAERALRLVIWYAHIIDHAIKSGYMFLAQEEAKTLLDDLQEGNSEKGIKTVEQINYTLEKVNRINIAAKNQDIEKAYTYAKEYLDDLKNLFNREITNDHSIDLTRGDYKISTEVFEQEVKNIGFKIIDFKSFGPIHTIGAMGVYVLNK
jgi:2-polyprenyl-3-methyl-5-hydroxy-6-metoxy-1,4-benzoquinol methylase